MSLRSKHAFRTRKVMVITADSGWEESDLFLVSVKRCSDISLVFQVELNRQREERRGNSASFV